MKSKTSRLLLFCALTWAHSVDLYAQLDTIHWIPPVYANIYEGDQFIDLSTPEVTPFQVTILNGAGVVLKKVVISKDKAVRYKLSGTYSQLLVPENGIQIILPASGLVIHGPKPFHAGFRFINTAETDAVYLTCKGRTALGKIFRIGNVWQVSDKTGLRMNVIGLMATEDNTVVDFSGFDPTLVEFWNGPVQITLQKGESYIFTHYIGGIGDDQPRNGFMGALLTATKPIVVTSGSWMGAPVIYDKANDIGIDQLLPLEQTGKAFVLCMGNGPTSLEHPIIIAHSDNTKIWLSDAFLPDTILQAGQFWLVPTLHYLPRNNLFIRSSEPVFVYQMIGGIKTGTNSLKTVSLMVVPPIQCGLPKQLDNIYLPNTLNKTRFDGGLMVVAQKNASVKAWVEGVERPLGDPTAVIGNPEFVTYRAMDFFSRVRTDSTLRVESDGAILVSLVLQNKEASYAAMFSSNVERRPTVQLSLKGDGICPDTLVASGDFDYLQWFYDDSLFQQGIDPRMNVLAPGKYKVIASINGCRDIATVLDSIVVDLAAPQFSYTSEEPSCFNSKDGQIRIETPNGGTPPYQYSIDFGKHFSGNPRFEMLDAGAYKLVVADGSGCFNEPIRLTLDQPDSVFVDLYFKELPVPLGPRETVVIEGTTGGNPIESSIWSPSDSTLCADCLEYTFQPEKSTWVHLTVYAETGCAGTDSIFVLVTPPVYAPNVIRPDSGTENAVFMLFSEYPLPVIRLAIFDRWGDLVFEQRDVQTNNSAQGWKGTYRGKDLPAGVYVFAARIEVEPGRFEDIYGDISLIR